MAQEPKKELSLNERIKAAGLENKTFTFIVKLKIKEGTKEKFEAVVAKTAKASLLEKGCGAYELHADSEHPGEYILWEKWKGLAALEAHMKEEHTKEILAMFGEVCAVPPTLQLLAPLK